MSKVRDLTGQTFGRLSVVRRDGSNKDGRAMWLCQCKCGNLTTVLTTWLTRGNKVSCGCKKVERAKTVFKTHGMSKTKIYKSWSDMKSRCDNENGQYYDCYGGRGIVYDEKWKTFEGFLEDMQDSYEEGLTLERVDVNKNYCKDNCCWIPMSKQAKNRRMQSNNPSGFTGIYVRQKKSGVNVYMAFWVDGLKRHTKSFSSDEYEDALKEALRCREDALKSMNYHPSHGK